MFEILDHFLYGTLLPPQLDDGDLNMRAEFFENVFDLV